MREMPAFSELEGALKRIGVQPRIIKRTITELQDHYVDLVAEAERAGFAPEAADDYARCKLGDAARIVDVVRQHAELMSWSSRHPLAAACGRSMICAIAIPVVPVVYCAQRRESLARWGLSVGLASVVTASLLLALYSMFPI